MITILAAVILVPHRDLVREIIFAGHFHRSPFHLNNIHREFLIQVQGGSGARPGILGIERTPLLEPVQLPDPKTNTQSCPCQNKQCGEQPFAL